MVPLMPGVGDGVPRLHIAIATSAGTRKTIEKQLNQLRSG